MMKLLPFLPLPSKPLTGAAAARLVDEAVFELHPDLVAFVRPMIELEFADAPEAMRAALSRPLMRPFRYLVEVTRADAGDLFPHRREVLQVRMTDGFDPSRPGTLRGGFLSNPDDRPAAPKSPGELSLEFYAPPQ